MDIFESKINFVRFFCIKINSSIIAIMTSQFSRRRRSLRSRRTWNRRPRHTPAIRRRNRHNWSRPRHLRRHRRR